jgi:hypothetical protein
LSELAGQLREAGFRGTVELRSYYGNFCLQKTTGGGLVLAEPDLEIALCLFSKDVRGNDTWRNIQTVAFANYLNLEQARSGGELEILTFSGGFDEPLVPYPATYEVKTAGEWNRIAAKNQRVRVSLYSNQ